MATKGGTIFLLLIVTCAALAKRPNTKPENRPGFKDMAKRLMRKCQEEAHPLPKMPLLRSVFSNGDSPLKDRNSDQSNTFLSSFMNILESVSDVKDSVSRSPSKGSDKMTNLMWNCSTLPAMIKMMKNSSEASACYMHAFVAPVSWEALTTKCENEMDSDNYESLLWGAKPALQYMPASRMNLPVKAPREKVQMMMKMLLDVYEPMSEGQRTRVVKWAKQQITQNYFNCTMMPSSDSRLKMMKRCGPSLKWLNTEFLTMMGPYLSRLEPKDVDASPKEKLCDFFRSAQFKSALKMVPRINPSLAKNFLKRFQECFSEKKEFAEHLDKLGALACHYNPAQDMTPELSRKLLSQLDDCNDPRIKKLKKRLVNSVMSEANNIEALRKLGSSVTMLSPKQLSLISNDDLKEVLKNLGPTVKWKRGQLRALAKKQLGDEKCKKVTEEELMDLRSVVGGLPICVLKNAKSKKILRDAEAQKNITKQMRKGQLKAMLQSLSEGVDPSEVVKNLQGPLLRSLSVSKLAKANITSLDQVEDKTWTRSQAAYLAKKMHRLNRFKYRPRLHSLLQGITCKMINKVADKDVEDMAQSITESPRWLSKVQTGCAARMLFKTLEKKRDDYFKTITADEIDEIPTVLLLHLPPSKVKELPDRVCLPFLDKMEMANLSLLPVRAPSRPALTQKALQCLLQGNDLSTLTTEDVSRLGPLLCELKPSQLRLMDREVLTSSLQAMASCQHIPKRHMADLIQLVAKTFGDPSDWSAETMENLGLLLLMDDDATSALPKKGWMKEILYFLKPRLSEKSDALKKKFFDLITTTSDAERKKRAANSDGEDAKAPTVEVIEELGLGNKYWTDAELDRMSDETFHDSVDTLGRVSDYSEAQLAVLGKKANEAFGPVSEMTESDVTQMGCITQVFPDTDLEKLPISLDSLEDISHCGWKDSQTKLIWKRVAESNNMRAQQLGTAEMVALNQFICGLNSSEIQELNRDSFREAVDSLGVVQCSMPVTQQLKSLAVSAFGDPSNWTEAQVSDLGNILAGLHATELAPLDPSVFPFISESCIPLIPPSNFRALSVAQLEALGPDNAAKVTSEQRLALGDEQLNALERAATGSFRNQTIPSSESGAPSLSVEGISAFMKPFLFLLTGFLLL